MMNNTDEAKIKMLAAERGILTAQYEAGMLDRDYYNLKILMCDIWPQSIYGKMGMTESAEKALKALILIKNLAAMGRIPENWEQCRVNQHGEVVEKE